MFFYFVLLWNNHYLTVVSNRFPLKYWHFFTRSQSAKARKFVNPTPMRRTADSEPISESIVTTVNKFRHPSPHQQIIEIKDNANPSYIRSLKGRSSSFPSNGQTSTWSNNHISWSTISDSRSKVFWIHNFFLRSLYIQLKHTFFVNFVLRRIYFLKSSPERRQ